MQGCTNAGRQVILETKVLYSGVKYLWILSMPNVTLLVPNIVSWLLVWGKFVYPVLQNITDCMVQNSLWNTTASLPAKKFLKFTELECSVLFLQKPG